MLKYIQNCIFIKIERFRANTFSSQGFQKTQINNDKISEINLLTVGECNKPFKENKIGQRECRHAIISSHFELFLKYYTIIWEYFRIMNYCMYCIILRKISIDS